MAKKKEKEKKGKKEKKEKKGKKGKRSEQQSEQQSEPRTAYDRAISTLGGTVCAYAVLTLLGILFAVALGVLAGI